MLLLLYTAYIYYYLSEWIQDMLLLLYTAYIYYCLSEWIQECCCFYALLIYITTLVNGFKNAVAFMHCLYIYYCLSEWIQGMLLLLYTAYIYILLP